MKADHPEEGKPERSPDSSQTATQQFLREPNSAPGADAPAVDRPVGMKFPRASDQVPPLNLEIPPNFCADREMQLARAADPAPGAAPRQPQTASAQAACSRESEPASSGLDRLAATTSSSQRRTAASPASRPLPPSCQGQADPSESSLPVGRASPADASRERTVGAAHFNELGR